LDIFIGLGITFAGLFLWTGMFWMAGIYIPILLPSFQAARRRFLQSRVRHLANIPRQQGQGLKVLFSMTLLSGVFLLAVIVMFFSVGFIPGSVNAWLRQYFLLVIGIIFASMWSLAGAILRIRRFYLYAVFTFIVMSLAMFTALPFWLALVLLGGLVAHVGLLLLIGFLQQHPVTK
jgi:hypothetical protein